LDKFRKLDLTIEANKERLIDSLMKCVLLYDDKLVITFNFKNEPVTVPTSEEFDAIEKSSDIKAFASPTKEHHLHGGVFLFVMRSAHEPSAHAMRACAWVRITASPSPVETSQGEADSRTGHSHLSSEQRFTYGETPSYHRFHSFYILIISQKRHVTEKHVSFMHCFFKKDRL
jgi:hypothetical protein